MAVEPVGDDAGDGRPEDGGEGEGGVDPSDVRVRQPEVLHVEGEEGQQATQRWNGGKCERTDVKKRNYLLQREAKNMTK